MGQFVFGLSKDLVTLHWVSSHLIWPFKVWLILDLLRDLVYWFSKHYINHLRSRRPRLPSKIPSGFVIVVSVQPEVPSLLRDNLSLSLPLLLVFLDPLVLINSVHELAYTGSELPSQRLP